MLKNYFKVAFRNLWRRKGYSFLNIAGLSVGMASAVLIALWAFNEISYDRFHQNKDRLFRAWNRGVFDGKLECWTSTPKILGPTLKLEFPEIENVTRVNSRWFVTRAGEKKLSSSALITDPAFFQMFSFPLIAGDPKTALDDNYSIVVTEKMALKMFGSENAMNKVITIDSNNYTVTGVMKNLPVNTKFDFEFILPWSFMKRTGNDDQDWGNNSIHTYVILKPNTSYEEVNKKIKNVTIAHSGGKEQQEIFLHPLTRDHLYTRFENGKEAGGRIETVRLFIAIAAFILVIACINFMNLTTARSERRAKEVGIRKVAGANKRLLVGQFLGESMLMTLISGIVALLLVQLSLPYFTLLVNKPLIVPYTSISFWCSALLFVALTGIIAGSYPAFFLSSFKPVSVLKGTFRKSYAAINPRKVLVVFQFTFAIILVISTMIILQQINHVQKRNAGFNKEQVVYIWLSGELYDKYQVFKQQLKTAGVAEYMTRTSNPIATVMSNTWGLEWKGKSPGDKTLFDVMTQDEHLVKTSGLKLVLGRDIDPVKFPSDSFAMIINESAVKAMRFKDPLGQTVRDAQFTYHIVGVVQDFVAGSPFEQTRPMVIAGPGPNWFNVVNFKLTGQRSVSENLALAENIYKKLNPDFPFEYHFVDEDYATKFNDVQRTARLTALFAALTILISCIGLFGLASYMAEARVKEIGIRKVLGASVFKITRLLSGDFLKLVTISIGVAIPIAWYAMHSWLENYTYRVAIGWWIFAVAAMMTLLITIITVGYQSIRAALVNPAKCLRND